MSATRGRLPQGSEWRYEVRWAGLRVLAEATSGRLRLTTPSERDVTTRFPELAWLGVRLRDAVLDGEIIILNGGAPSRAALDARLAGKRTGPATLMVSDVLRLYGVPLLGRPLDERRATLERVLTATGDGVALSPVYDDGPALLDAARKHRLHGVVAKRADSPYRPGVRSTAWVAVPAS